MAADFSKTQGFSVETGEPLLEGRSKQGYNAPAAVFVIDDLVWMAGKGGRNAMDLKTGEVRNAAQGLHARTLLP